jgi:hypothetical protein
VRALAVSKKSSYQKVKLGFDDKSISPSNGRGIRYLCNIRIKAAKFYLIF